MAGRLDKVRDLKLELPDETSAPARRWGFWLFLAIVVAGGAFLALRNLPLRSSAATVVASDATLTSAPINTPVSNGFTAAGYVEPVPPFPIHISPLVLGGIDEFGCLRPFKHFPRNAIPAADVRIGWNGG